MYIKLLESMCMKRLIVYCVVFVMFCVFNGVPVFADSSTEREDVNKIIRKTNLNNDDVKKVYKFGRKYGKEKKQLFVLKSGQFQNEKYLKIYELDNEEDNAKILVASTEDLQEVKEISSCFLPFQKFLER